ncbi:alpha/beta fold hydrolase [Nocardioides panaciterrulae]|uniref:Pimeloyl-ACP methyl ester carboxylesterase n=1 Tax=Nocardioides panaciterrulae TaxID=661492 RepID=A0A7Y9E7E8_9ACTN|nr:alpha/beta hydrolase [Nocardioides panaciterrulae]NYD42524.1 pimeloyl-ACP methyl ester carboxylesterase [Nocardioides panaciterrulae]
MPARSDSAHEGPDDSAEGSPEPAARIGFQDIRSDDGTHLRAWTNDPAGRIDGPTVVLCNGLGTNPWAWPALLDPDCGVRVVSWNHRGTGGSARPADPERVGIDAFVEDALSVMDHFGLDRAVLVGWSMGVNTMFELALTHPERVAGLFAVAGVPGDTFSTMLGPLRLPRFAAKAVAGGASRALRLGGRALTPVVTRLPVGPRGLVLISHSGFMFPVPDRQLAVRAVREFLRTPVEWYAHLALHTARHGRVPLSRIDAPAVFVAGRYDVLAGARQMATAAERMADATYVELRGSHFVQMEQPTRVHELLLEFLDRVG